MTGVAAPLGEEFFFRGFLFRVLWEKTNVSVATFATGVVFGLVHAGDTDISGVLLLGVLGAAIMRPAVAYGILASVHHVALVPQRDLVR